MERELAKSAAALKRRIIQAAELDGSDAPPTAATAAAAVDAAVNEAQVATVGAAFSVGRGTT